ncbi:MAG: hypothetical protein K2K44_11155 [Oscillospiraceae bacterium]|nr:hypothetical protein [Oscillospiraceae bacterium]
MEENKSTWKSLTKSYHEMLTECNELSNMLLQKGNITDGSMMKEIHDRMELIHYKAEILILFVKTFKAAEAENIDLGSSITGHVSCHYNIFISDLDLDINNCYPHYFANTKCYDLFCRWQKLCEAYKEYFLKTIDLPKGIDLSPYYLALEIFE